MQPAKRKNEKKPFVLGIDAGNTHIVLGLFQETQDLEIFHHGRVATQSASSSQTLNSFLQSFLTSLDLSLENIHAFIYSSVVPNLNPIFQDFTRNYLSCGEAIECRWDMGLPLTFCYPQPQEIGTDRLVNACAAVRLYGGDLIIIDMGTATSFCVIHKEKQYMGGSIAPGLKLSMEGLGKKAALLTMPEFRRPPSGVIGKSTAEAIQAGFFFGWVGLMREIITCIRKSNPERHYKIIATGGLSQYVQRESQNLFDEVNPLLTLQGLKYIYYKLN